MPAAKKKYLFVGDTHGDLTFAILTMHLAREAAAEIIQVGDWGFIWNAKTQVQELSAALVAHGVTMRFIDGNHDDHPQLRTHVRTCAATPIADHLIYQPRGSVHEDEDGTRFLFLGGAPSIDRRLRVAGLSWWPEETITTAEFAQAQAANAPIHVLVTHDAPSFPPGFAPKGSPDYRRAQDTSMHRVDAIIRHSQPTLHVHGHWHTHYERRHAVGTRVVGLDRNQASRLEASTLLWSRAGAA